MAAHPPRAKKSLLQEFKDFLNQGDFVTIAVGLIIALYFQKIVDSILAGVLFPIIAAIFSFIVVAALLFLILKAYNRMRATKTGAEADTELSVLREIRDSVRAGGRGPV